MSEEISPTEEDHALEKWFRGELEKPAKPSPLKGISQIEVRVTLSDRAEKFNLRKEVIKQSIEKLLKDAGMVPVSRDTDHEIESWNHARMEVWVSLIPNKDRSAAYISLDVQDSAKLTRNQTSVYAVIWNAEVLFSYTDHQEMRNDIVEKIISFTNDFIYDFKIANLL